MPTNYERGRSAENYVKRKLKAQGASLVIRSGRSLTPFDLVAFFPENREIHLIQVKTSKKGVNLAQVVHDYQDVMKGYDGGWNVRTVIWARSKLGWHHQVPWKKPENPPESNNQYPSKVPLVPHF